MPIYKTDRKNKEGLAGYRVRVNYVDDNGENRQLTRIAYGKQEAKDLEGKLISKMRNGGGDNDDITVEEMYNRFKSDKLQNVRASSFDKSTRILERHVIPYFKKTNVKKLNTQKLSKWKEIINETNLNITSKKNVYTEFNSMLNWAVRMEMLEKNPLTILKNFKDPYEYEPTLHYYTKEQFEKFRDAAHEYADEYGYMDYYIFFLIAWYTGARKGEINALRWSDYADGSIKINKSVTQKLHGGDMFTPPKNKSSNRTIKAPKYLVDKLQQHYNMCQERYENFDGDYYICGGGRPLRDTSLQNEQKKYEKKAELPHIRIHDFRHSHATLLINNGINIMEVARRLGHANVNITYKVYAHLYPNEEVKCVELFDMIDDENATNKEL